MYMMHLTQSAEIHMCMTRCKVCGTGDDAIIPGSNLITAGIKLIAENFQIGSLGIE